MDHNIIMITGLCILVIVCLDLKECSLYSRGIYTEGEGGGGGVKTGIFVRRCAEHVGMLC